MIEFGRLKGLVAKVTLNPELDGVGRGSDARFPEDYKVGHETTTRNDDPDFLYHAVFRSKDDAEFFVAACKDVPALLSEFERVKDAYFRLSYDVEQTLGRALGYPRYCDDQKNFPGSTDADGVCVGDHVPGSLAMEAADRIRQLESQSKEQSKRVDQLRNLIKKTKGLWATAVVLCIDIASQIL